MRHPHPALTQRLLSPLICAAILLLAAALRLYRLDLIDLRYDEALAPLQALNITRGEWLGLAPFSGSVINHPPLFLYFLAVPYLFTRNLCFVAAYRVLLDVLAVLGCWLLCRRYFNLRVAHLAALLFAVAPWAVQSARKLSIEALPLCSLIFIWGLLKVAHERDSRGWAIAGLGLALSVGVHLSSAPLAVLVLVIAWIHRDTLRLRPVLLGLLPLAVLATLYGWHDAGTGFENINAVLKHSNAPRLLTVDGLRTALWMSGGAHLSDLTGNAYSIWQAQPAALFGGIDTVQMGLVVLAAVAPLSTLRQYGRRSPVLILLLWWWVPVLSQSYVNQPVQLHYFTVSYPAPFILIALLIDPLLQRHTAWRWISVSAIVLLGVWQGFSTFRFAAFVDQHFTAGGYGAPLRNVWSARTRASAPGQPNHEVIAVIQGFPTPWNEQAVVLRVVLADLPYRFLNDEGDGFVMRPDQTHYVFAPGSEAALQQLTTLYASDPSAMVIEPFPTKPDGTGYTHVWLKQPFNTSAFVQQPNPVWANRVELAQHRISLQAGQAQVELILRILDTPPPGSDYHWTVRLLHDDQPIAQQDFAGVHPESWRAEDLLYLKFTLPLPAAGSLTPTALRIGSYTYPAIKPVMVSVPGQPASDGVTLLIER